MVIVSIVIGGHVYLVIAAEFEVRLLKVHLLEVMLVEFFVVEGNVTRSLLGVLLVFSDIEVALAGELDHLLALGGLLLEVAPDGLVDGLLDEGLSIRPFWHPL